MQFTTCVLGFESGPKMGYGMYPGAGTSKIPGLGRGHFAMYPVIQVISTTLLIFIAVTVLITAMHLLRVKLKVSDVYGAYR